MNRHCIKFSTFGFTFLACIILSWWYFQGSLLRQAHSHCPSPVPQNVSAVDGESARRFPQAIIVGVRKGGTRALIDMLALHPQISAARPEVHYFDYDSNFDKGVQWYIDQMPLTRPDQITMEKSPSYFVTPHVPQRMSMVSRSLKLILILRDPVTRLISDYAQLLAKDKQKYSLEDKVFNSTGHLNTAWAPVVCSMYDVHIARWLGHFRREQIHIVDGDKFIEHPFSELLKVETYLRLEPFFNSDMFTFNKTKGFYCWMKVNGKESHVCLGNEKGRPHPFVSQETVSRLKDFYKPHNQQFRMLTGTDLRW